MDAAGARASGPALIENKAEADELARDLDADVLFPLLRKYAKPVHPFGTRERVLSCLAERDEWQAVELLVTFIDGRTENDELRGQAAALLADKDCTSIANDVLDVLTRDLRRTLQVAPALIGVTKHAGGPWRLALGGLRTDLKALLELTEAALAQIPPAEPAGD